MKVLIIHGDDGNPSEIHGAVLVGTDEERTRAQYAIRQWYNENEEDVSGEFPDMDEWLKDKGFAVLDPEEVFL